MAQDPEKAALALHRFGFGPRAGTIAAIAADPQGALLAELDRPNAGRLLGAELPSSDAEFRTVFEFNAAKRAEAKLVRTHAGNAAMQDVMAAQTVATPGPLRTAPLPRRIFLSEAKARIDAARDAEIGFVERLVWFWSNHCVFRSIVITDSGGR